MSITKKIVTAKRLARHFWTKACEHDGIDPSSMFAVLSSENPWAELVNRSASVLQATVFAYHNAGRVNNTAGRRAR
jgi:hypothetical protein